jgi:hypothetical protein
MLALLLATGAVASHTTGDDPSFPFYFDIGFDDRPWNNTITWPHELVPRVQVGKIFECPHPCGLFPSYETSTSTGKLLKINGGVPQSPDFNLTMHLSTLAATFSTHVSDDESRYIDLDFEGWNPVFRRNSNTSFAYIESIELAKHAHPACSSGAGSGSCEALAAAAFEPAALKLLLETAHAVRKLRKRIKLGFYGFPMRAYWQGYSTSAGDGLRADNDKLLPLFCEMDGLFPSVYQFYNSEDPSKTAAQNAATKKSNAQYVRSVVGEAVRLKQLAAKPGSCAGSAADRVQRVMAYTVSDILLLLSGAAAACCAVLAASDSFRAGTHT